MAVVAINSGPVSATDQLRNVPQEKWHDLMLARRQFMEIHLSHDCRCLIEFVNDAVAMYSALGFTSVEDMIRNGYHLQPEEIDVAVEWLRLNPPKQPIALDAVTALALRNQALDAKAPDLQPAHRPKKGSATNVGTTLSRGADYYLAKLRKDAPAIHARVLAGEFSPHAGMIPAGFRKKRVSKKPTPFERVLKLLPKLSDAECAELERLIRKRRDASP